MVFLDLSCINPIRHMSPRWGFKGFGVLVFYTHIAPLGLQKNSDLLLLCTLRSSGARGLDLSPSYRHIAPLERKIENLTGGGTPPLQIFERFRPVREILFRGCA